LQTDPFGAIPETKGEMQKPGLRRWFDANARAFTGF
jgi:hypothetical protein